VEYSSWVDSLLRSACFGGYFFKAEIDYLHVMTGWGALHDEPNQVSLQCRKCWSVYRNLLIVFGWDEGTNQSRENGFQVKIVS
jgi:hypothetical protein